MSGLSRKLARHAHSLERWLDARELRERVLLAVGVLAVLGAAWSVLAIDPARARARALQKAAAEIEAELVELTEHAREIREAHATDPNTELRARADALRQQIGAVDESIRAHTVAMVPPREMARFLEEMLAEQTELRLVRVENLGAEPLLAASEQGAGADAEVSGARVYKHAFEVELEGRYLAALSYLEALEALPWGFFWEALAYEVEDYPRGRATLRAYTLSSEEEWIGV